MGDMVSWKQCHWLRLLAAAAAMSAMVAQADEPIQTGIRNSIRQVGPMAGSPGPKPRRSTRLPFEILRVSGEVAAAPPTTLDPVAKPALVRIEDPPPPVPAPLVPAPPVPAPPAAVASADSSDTMIGGVAEIRYISSAWPGTWRPSECTDIAFQPLGAGVAAALGRQIYKGSLELMTLYDFDFYRADTGRRAELTERGLYQLQKYVRRLEFVPATIKVQVADADAALDAARREHVVRQLAAWGVPNAETLVVLGRVRFGVPASEAVETADGLDRVVETRGRTVTPDTSARFGTGRSSSGFAR